MDDHLVPESTQVVSGGHATGTGTDDQDPAAGRRSGWLRSPSFAQGPVAQESFRRVCMSFDAWVVSFGISTLLRDLHIVDSGAAFVVMAVVIAVDAWLLIRFFSGAQTPAVSHAA